MAGYGNFQNFSKLGGGLGVTNKLKWAEKIENSLIDPLTIREGRVITKFDDYTSV